MSLHCLYNVSFPYVPAASQCHHCSIQTLSTGFVGYRWQVIALENWKLAHCDWHVAYKHPPEPDSNAQVERGLPAAQEVYDEDED